MTTTQIPPLDVNIVSGTLDTGTKRPKEYRVSHKTVVLTAANPAQQLAGNDPARCEIYITVMDNPVVLSSSTSQANDAANVSTPSLATPNGRILDKTNGSEYCVKGSDDTWVSTSTFPTRVGFTIVREI